MFIYFFLVTMETKESTVFDKLARKLNNLSVNMMNPTLYRKYVMDPPKQLVRLNKNEASKIKKGIINFIELNKYDVAVIPISENEINFTRYIIKDFTTGICEESIIDIHCQSNVKFLSAYVIGGQNMYHYFFNFMAELGLVVDYEGDTYTPDLKKVNNDYEMLPSIDEVRQVFLCDKEGTQNREKMLKTIYQYSTKKECAVRLFREYRILELISYLLKNKSDVVFVPVLMILNHIFHFNDFHEINKMYPSLLYFIQDTVNEIYNKYDVGNMYFRNAMMHSGQVKSYFH